MAKVGHSTDSSCRKALSFPITKLGLTADVHGEGAFCEYDADSRRLLCARRKGPEPGKDPQRLEILPSPLHPDRGTELAVAYEFEQQFSLRPLALSKLPRAGSWTGQVAKRFQSRGPPANRLLRTFYASRKLSSTFTMNRPSLFGRSRLSQRIQAR